MLQIYFGEKIQKKNNDFPDLLGPTVESEMTPFLGRKII